MDQCFGTMANDQEKVQPALRKKWQYTHHLGQARSKSQGLLGKHPTERLLGNASSPHYKMLL